MTFQECEARYKSDSEFHAVVDLFYHMQFNYKLTVEELKDALMFACLRFERENCFPIMVDKLGNMTFIKRGMPRNNKSLNEEKIAELVCYICNHKCDPKTGHCNDLKKLFNLLKGE